MDELEHLYPRRIWTWIVWPILDSLNLGNLTQGDRLPHITWCPTGALAQLPLHAAGIYDEPYGLYTYDLVVSSYIPSLSTFGHAHGVSSESRPAHGALIVTQPSTPNLSSLPGTVEEGTRLREILETSGVKTIWLNDRSATVNEVRTAMKEHPWVHLACHGSQKTGDATRSAFHLFDGVLTLSDLMGIVADDAELAFLSACETAVCDKKTPEESAHFGAGMLAVGYKGVIVTMWSIQDADTPVVVDACYKDLLALRSGGKLGQGETGAAYALHEATRVLREKMGESNLLRWVPFVHFGV
ncbi:unnamed protein product [Peniophora sp. CBMAI 1063]|nr:unnamed protein product [Peniophora sp. CBMAI 1063]